MIEQEWKELGYIDKPIPADIDICSEIRRMCKEKNAVIMAHYYTDGKVQDVADFVGDSLALAQKAASTDAQILVMCGVHFIGETSTILCPGKKVIIPDLNASCSLAESCPTEDFERFVKQHPEHTVISYVNTTAATKTLTHIVVTSSNAKQVVESLPHDTPIIFGPDENLGNYINTITHRNMLLWKGGCHVHEKFSAEKIQELKTRFPHAKVIAHPECKRDVLDLADVVGSTAALLKFTTGDEATQFIVATECGILHKMKKLAPHKKFIPAPTDDPSCELNECNYMKLITLNKLYNSLKYEWPTITVEPDVARKAIMPIDRMLKISKELGL